MQQMNDDKNGLHQTIVANIGDKPRTRPSRDAVEGCARRLQSGVLHMHKAAPPMDGR